MYVKFLLLYLVYCWYLSNTFSLNPLSSLAQVCEAHDFKLLGPGLLNAIEIPTFSLDDKKNHHLYQPFQWGDIITWMGVTEGQVEFP